MAPISSIPPSPPSAVRSDPPPFRRPGTFRALRHYNYRLYFTGQIVSLTGSWVQTTAMTWLAYDLTGQSRWPALVLAAQVLPTFLLGVWGGSLADRWPRRPLIFLTQAGLLALAVLLAALVVLDLATPPALLLVSFGIGVVNAIDTPARLAFVIDLVGRDDLMNAIALNSMVFNVARAIGPAIGGLLLPHVGAGGCFLFNGVTFLAILGGLLGMRLPPAPTRSHVRPDAARLLDGFRHLARHRDLVLLIVLAGAMAFFGWPLQSLLPAVSDQQLGKNNAGYSWMLSGIGIGALVGALIVASFGTPWWRRRFLVLGVLGGAVALLGLAAADVLALAVLWCAVSGCGLILFFATSQATLQLGADEHNRGRIMGIWLMVLSGCQPAGNLVSGLLADHLGVTPVLLLGAIGITGAAGGVVLLALLPPADQS